MKHALIKPQNARIFDLQDKPYPFAAPFHWVEVPDDTTTDHFWDGEKVVSELPQPPEQTAADRIEAIKRRLTQIDAESVRPIRALEKTPDAQADRDRLIDLESEAETLRSEIADLLS